ncbi:hypothetical protein M2280_004088 [Prescottella agglutinans]|uniref:Uncharacterized protein n=1 Tax=Prescottella agglutinans TaxID=1644129 RepID=A0ABT6MEX7_9NOCA|nr:hypothetical protein [Prescottella agglutinans]
MRFAEVRSPSCRGGRNWYTCHDCGKRTYPVKKDAKQAARQLHDEVRHVYRCNSGSGWHCGRLPIAVKAGKVSRSAWYSHHDSMGN